MGAIPVDYRSAPDFWVSQALREIKAQYGVHASVDAKLKSLTKFGRTANADNGVKTTIATFQGAVVNETFVSTNVIDAIISSSTSDVSQTIVIEGHTIDGDGNLTFVVQEAQLNGQTSVPLTTPLARATRLYVKNGTFAAPATDLVGNVYCYDDTDGDNGSGVPTTAAATKVMIVAGKNQSEKCATSISSSDFWLISEAHMAMGRAGGSASADLEIEVRQLGGVWKPVGMEGSLRSTVSVFEHLQFYPLVIIPPNSDVRMVGTTTLNDTPLAGRIEGVLAKIV